MLQNLFHDESGFVISTELILVSTILVVGIIVGQTTLRDQVVTEFADTADAVSALDQSYLYSEIVVATHGSVAGTTFSDAADFCDANDNGAQGLDASGTCVLVDTGTAGVGAGVDATENNLTTN